MTRRKTLSILILHASMSLLLVACLVGPEDDHPQDDHLQDADYRGFPSSISPILTLEHVTYSGPFGGSPPACNVVLIATEDGGLVATSAFAPLVVRKVNRDGQMVIARDTGLGGGMSTHGTCIVGEVRDGIAVVTGARITLLDLEARVLHTVELPEDVRPGALRATPEGGIVKTGTRSGGDAVLLKLSAQLEVAWQRSYTEISIHGAAVRDDGEIIALGRSRHDESLAAAVIVDPTGDTRSIHWFEGRRPILKQAVPLRENRLLLVGEIYGPRYRHTWIMTIDEAGTVLWDNEALWEEWYRAITPRSVLRAIEQRDGTIILIGTGVNYPNGGLPMKTTIIAPDGRLQHQGDWPTACYVLTMTMVSAKDMYVAYKCGNETAMSGWRVMDYRTQLHRAR